MNLHVEQLGNGGPPLVLVHGWGLSSRVWAGLVPDLTRRRRLCLVDLPGHGSSAEPDATTTVQETAAVVARSVPSAAWVGWSLGGLVALCAAIKHPDQVERIVLVASTPCFVTAPGWPNGLEPSLLESFACDLEADPEATLARFLALQVRGSTHRIRAARELTRTLRAARPPSSRGLRCGLAWLRGTDLRDRLAAVRCPVHLILGQRDVLVRPAVLEDVLRLRADWTGEVVAGAGHAPFLIDPPAFSGLLSRALGDGA